MISRSSMPVRAKPRGSWHRSRTAYIRDAPRRLGYFRDGLAHIRDHREACLQVVSLLSQDLHVAYDRVRSLGLGRTRRSRAPRVN